MGDANIVDEMFTIKKTEPILVRPPRKTPEGNYFLSNIEQIWYYHSDFIFSFKENREKWSTDTVFEVMKGSLAEALVHFYPLAGRIDGKFVVDCTGEGVPFVEAHVETKKDVLGDISFVMLPQLIYSPEGAITAFNKPPLMIQVTRFECGGFVLGVSMSSLLSDGKSLGEFIVSLSEIARGLQLTCPPFLDRSILRARQPPKIEFPHHEFSRKKGRDVMWMIIETPLAPLMDAWPFCFNPNLLAQMKSDLIMNDHSIRFPTTFELVTASVWRNRTKALKIESGPKVRVVICVDLREKIGGMFPKGYFGVGVATSMCYCDAGGLVQKPLSFAIKLVQDTISLVTTRAYVQSFIDYFEATRSDFEFENTCSITKLQRLPLYESDFGWGHPTQVAPATLPYEEIYYLSQGKDSENIVFSLSLPISSMKIFQELMQLEFNQDHAHLPGFDTP